jgi:hypothetical protein
MQTHEAKDYLTNLISQTMTIWWTDIEYHRYFVNALCQKLCEEYSGYRRIRFHRS